MLCSCLQNTEYSVQRSKAKVHKNVKDKHSLSKHLLTICIILRANLASKRKRRMGHGPTPRNIYKGDRHVDYNWDQMWLEVIDLRTWHSASVIYEKLSQG